MVVMGGGAEVSSRPPHPVTIRAADTTRIPPVVTPPAEALIGSGCRRGPIGSIRIFGTRLFGGPGRWARLSGSVDELAVFFRFRVTGWLPAGVLAGMREASIHW